MVQVFTAPLGYQVSRSVMRDLLHRAVPIVATGQTNELLPQSVVVLDSRNHPEVGDLLRVFFFEGPGAGRYTWTIGDDGEQKTVFLLATVAQPVEVEFIVAFPLSEHRDFLQRLAQRRFLNLTFAFPDQQQPIGMLRFAINGPLLKKLITSTSPTVLA